MNSRTRVLTALRLGQPDRVPHFEWEIDPRVIDALMPGASLPDFVEEMGLDAIAAPPRYAREYLDESTFRDEWGVTFMHGGESWPVPRDGPIKTREDWEQYRLPDPTAEGRLGNLLSYIKRFEGEKAIVFQHRAGFMNACYLRGMSNLLMDFAIAPDFAEAIIGKLIDYSEALARHAIRAGADIVMLGDDYAWNAGPFMSPQHFRRFLLPGLSHIVNVIHEEGALCIKHTDGNIWKLMEPLIGSGIDGLNPFEPLAAMDIGKVKKRYGHLVCISGNIDCGHTLSIAPVEDVTREVKACLQKAAPGGGYILMSSNSIHSSVKPENYEAMIRAVHELGQYPLDMNALAET